MFKTGITINCLINWLKI